MGTVEVGKLADLILLDANPLLDFQHKKNKCSCGKWKIITKKDFDKLLEEVREKVNRSN